MRVVVVPSSSKKTTVLYVVAAFPAFKPLGAEYCPFTTNLNLSGTASSSDLGDKDKALTLLWVSAVNRTSKLGMVNVYVAFMSPDASEFSSWPFALFSFAFDSISFAAAIDSVFSTGT